MIRYYARFDADGFPIAFYADDVWPVSKIPTGAVQIAEAVWRDLMANQGRRKWVNGKVASYQGGETPEMARRIEWGDVIRAMTANEAEAFDAAVQMAGARFRWLIAKTAYIATDDPDYPTLEGAFIGTFGATRAAELLGA